MEDILKGHIDKALTGIERVGYYLRPKVAPREGIKEALSGGTLDQGHRDQFHDTLFTLTLMAAMLEHPLKQENITQRANGNRDLLVRLWKMHGYRESDLCLDDDVDIHILLKCRKCGKVMPPLACEGCSSVHYCNEECRERHSKAHNKLCKSI